MGLEQHNLLTTTTFMGLIIAMRMILLSVTKYVGFNPLRPLENTSPTPHFTHAPLLTSSQVLAQLERVASLADDSTFNLGRTKQSVRVWDAGECTKGSIGSSAVEDNVLGDSVPDLLRVDGQNGPVDVLENCAFNQSLSSHAGVNGSDAKFTAVVDIVENVGSAESEQRHAGVDVLPVVVGIGDAQLALVFAAVVVAVADERSFEVVVEVGVADGEVVGSVAEVGQAVVVVLAGGQVRRQVQVVKPDVGRLLDADCITARVAGLDLADGYVADDDVLCCSNEEPKAGQARGRVKAENRFVAANADLLGAGDFALDVDDRSGIAFDGSNKFGIGADGDRSSSCSASCSAVQRSVANRLGILSRDERGCKGGKGCRQGENGRELHCCGSELVRMTASVLCVVVRNVDI